MTTSGRKATALISIVTFMVVPALLGGCGNGPGIIDRHDFSAFYDFGGFDDVAEPDDGAADVSAHDTFYRDDGGPDASDTAGRDDGDGHDTARDDSAGDTGTDTTVSGPTVTFVTDKAWETRANAMIGGAKTSVDLVHLEFLIYSPEDISIAGSLKKAAGRGVGVRVLLDDDVDDNPTRVDELDAVANIQAKLDNWSGTTHVKMIIVDDSQVLVGSTNLSKSSLHFNHEANLYITDKAAVPEYVDYFDALWSNPDNKKKMAATMTGAGILPIGDGEYVGAVEQYLLEATTRVWLVMYDLNQGSGSAQELTDLMLDAKDRGVEVKAFFERCNDDYAFYVTEDNEESAEILEAGGAEVKFDEATAASSDLITHAKLLIVDDTVVVYSGNWNDSGLVKNHEAGAIVDGVDSVTDAAEKYFNTLWNTGVDWP